VRIEVLHIAGPVPVKRGGTVELAELAAHPRRAVEAALRAALAARARQPAGPAAEDRAARIPDVGSAAITVVEDDGTRAELSFSDAEATAEEAALLRTLRPFLKTLPWSSGTLT
jgi:hypothetical protein